jgi:hypothetical protein
MHVVILSFSAAVVLFVGMTILRIEWEHRRERKRNRERDTIG